MFDLDGIDHYQGNHCDLRVLGGRIDLAGVIYTLKSMGALLDLTPDKLGDIRSATEPMALPAGGDGPGSPGRRSGPRRDGRDRSYWQRVWGRRWPRVSRRLGQADGKPNIGDGIELQGSEHGRLRKRGTRIAGGDFARSGLRTSSTRSKGEETSE
jgi:hypothetical protein